MTFLQINVNYLFLLVVIIFVITECNCQKTIQPSKKPSVKVYQISPNSTSNSYIRFEIPIDRTLNSVTLSKGHKLVELVCKADYPITWEYVDNDKPLPILEIQYNRTLKAKSPISVEDFANTRKNSFEGRVTLRGLLESQSGRYVCRYYNTKNSKNSYSNATILDVYIPGEHILTELQHVKFISKFDQAVVIPCPTSDPNVHIRLYKLRDEHYNKTGELRWRSIHPQYDHTLGFILTAGLGNNVFGYYNCSIDNHNKTLIVAIVEKDDPNRSEYEAALDNESTCWRNETCLKFLRSKRLECFCKNSYGLFVNEETFEEENRVSVCSEETLTKYSKSFDWRVSEFFNNGEKSSDVCFDDDGRKNFNGTGSRVLLRAFKMETENYDNVTKMLNLTVTYDGLPNWGAGFKIGLRRKPENDSFVEILDKEPNFIQNYPLAHYRAVWNGLIVDSEIYSHIHVFQPDSFSFDWFEISESLSKAYTKMNDKSYKSHSDEHDHYPGCCSRDQVILIITITFLAVIVVLALVSFYITVNRARKSKTCDVTSSSNRVVYSKCTNSSPGAVRPTKAYSNDNFS